VPYEQQLPGRSQQPLALPGGASASGASSTSVSQSLSLPSQTSGCGPVAPWQTIAPLTHAVLPGMQGSWLMPQG
jgi:hypothetical protein